MSVTSSAEAAMVISSVVTVVSELQSMDEQSTGNLDIIANIYVNINDLVASGNINVSDSVCVFFANRIDRQNCVH